MVSAKLMLYNISFLSVRVALLTCVECNTVILHEVEDTTACPNNCRTNGSDIDICNHTSGECLRGCKDGFAGQNCTLRCTDIDRNCKLCSTDSHGRGLICNECKRNFYRDNGKCLECNYWCKGNVSSSVATCRESDGYCEQGCRSGRYGFKCGLRCSSTCKDICHRDNGTCENGCKYTSYCGPTCDLACQDGCVSQHCNQSCSCEEGCNINYWGEKCQKLCNVNCNRPTGNIIAAIDATEFVLMDVKLDRIRTHCTQQCSDRCLDKRCFADTGNCSYGCAIGYKGLHCDKDLESHMCFGCEDMSSPQYCDEVTHCQGNEICFLESHHQAYGNIYRSGCMDEKKCHVVETNNTSAVCVECCSNNMCNNKGCGNTDFPPREHRGPMCFDCQHTGDPKLCDTVTVCTTNQVCSIEKYQWGDSFHYKQGCVHQVCNTLSRHTRSVPLCHSCCHDDFCNLNCTSNTYNNGDIFVG